VAAQDRMKELIVELHHHQVRALVLRLPVEYIDLGIRCNGKEEIHAWSQDAAHIGGSLGSGPCATTEVSGETVPQSL
jgi:hypothetical protein